MPPTGSSYPPTKINLNLKIPRLSINSLKRHSSSLSPETHRRLLEADRRWRAKCILRVVAAVFALIGFSLFAAAIVPWDKNFFYYSGPNRGDWTDGFPIGVLVFAFVYDLVLLFFLLFRKSSTHPLIPLIVDFLIWGGLVPAITFAAWGGLFEYWRPAIRTDDGEVICNILNIFARECHPIFYSVGSLELAGVVFACLVWFMHFALFVLACIDTHRWRRARRVNRKSTGGASTRILDHSDFVDSHERSRAQHAPPQYRENTTADPNFALHKEIELSPISPTEREFV